MKFTKMLNKDTIQKDWVVVDAKDKIFGRVITEIATILRGKHKPSFTPHVDCGDYVVVINASEAKFSGNKLTEKNYYTHSGYFGSTKTHKLADMLEKNPEKLYKLAVRGMLPKNKLSREAMKRLRVFKGENHNFDRAIKKTEDKK